MAGTKSARGAAAALLDAVLASGALLSQALTQTAEMDGLTAQDRARAQRLATEVLRRIEPLDIALGQYLRKAPRSEGLNILRLALHEITTGAAPHGVVNEAVALAKSRRETQHQAAMINAVLRQIPPGPLAGPVQKLPRWMRQPMVHAYGREAVAAIEAVQAQEPPLDLSFKPGAELPGGELLSTGSLRLAAPGQISGLAGYAAGGWWVQDAAAALPARLLAPAPGTRVLDLCAAPGGKTAQLAAMGAEVTALDISGPRMARVAENLARLGLPAQLVVADALHWQPDAAFDAILLDAPCSASGTIRRHPDLPFVKDGSDLEALTALQAGLLDRALGWLKPGGRLVYATCSASGTIRRHPDLPFVKDGSDLEALTDLQSSLLDRALGWLKPGGRLVYATCSLLPQEGEAQLASALARHPGLRVVPADLPGLPPGALTPEGALRLRPDFWADRGGMDGFFIVCLKL